MKKTNKEIADQLTSYFMQQSKEDTCKTLAHMMIDMNRMFRIDELTNSERESLLYRMDLNLKQLYEFIEKGPKGDFKLTLHNSQ